MKEKEIEDKVEKNLRKIESGLKLVERQKRVSTGIIDLFCKDKNGKYVIVEIKRKPDTKVITQLAKYNMALIKDGFRKRRLRTILVAQELSKHVKETCEFFKFEIKNVYKERNLNEKEESDNRFRIPSKEELVTFIKSKKFVNLSMIARFFNIYNNTALDLVNDLKERNLAHIKKFGGSKIIILREK
ncbi:MAG: endonuclease NucS domain-containing protein [Nanoarchaeota archaeon]